MKNLSLLLSSRLALITAAVLIQVGCSFPVEEQDEDLGIVQQAAMTENSLTENGLTQNGLLMGELSENAVASMFLKYVVSCALPAGQNVNLVINETLITFHGQLGLAPEWGEEHGSCDGTCRAWISACVLSRVNYLGANVPLSLRGATSALTSTDSERSAYPNSEATYYGDIFTSSQKRFACKSPNSTLISRVCGGDGVTTTGCVVDVVDTCDNVCDSVDPVEGYYQNCRDRLNKVYPISVSVFRQ